MLELLKGLNKVVYFLLELSMLTALGYTGFQSSQHPFWKYVLAIGLPLVAIVIWGIYQAPRSEHRLPIPYRAIVAMALFGITTFMLYRTHHFRLAIAFGIVACICQGLAYWWKQ